MFLIARLSKCFVCVASKLFLLKEQAYRKALRIIEYQELRRWESQGLVPKTFTQMNKKSMAYKRALFIEQFDKMLREEELRIIKDPKRQELY